MKILVIIERGGTWKTSFVAILTKYLIENEETPLLLVDSYPDQNLGELVCVDLHEKGEKVDIRTSY